MLGGRPIVRRSLTVAAITGAAAISARALVRPRAGSDRRLLDWDAVERAARARSGERERLRPEAGRRLAGLYDRYAAELGPLMGEVLQSAAPPLPGFTVLDRTGFIEVNLVMVRRLLEPLEQLRATLPDSALTGLGRGLTSRYVGALVGLMSQRVLGQYDPVLMPASSRPAARPPGTLYLVEPNVEQFQRAQQVSPESLRRWLILHELTHAWQFLAHPWLAEHIEGLMGTLVMGGLPAAAAGSRRWRPRLRAIGTGVAGQLAAASRLQATMSVLEGHANFVMHRVGRPHIVGSARLESAFQRRQDDRTAVERLVLSLSGLALKMRQYQLGERFCEQVAAGGGLELVNRVWERPEAMPTMAELRDPARWMARVARRG
jgi:coenzyme F420 biosynthesis associated uncharacterized protein